jgi:hypothetical protein
VKARGNKWQVSTRNGVFRRHRTFLYGESKRATMLMLVIVLVTSLGNGLFSHSAAASAQGQAFGLQVDFTPASDRAHPHLDTLLTLLIEAERAAPDEVLALAQAHDMRLDSDGRRVQVQLKVTPGAEDAVTAAVMAAGGEAPCRPG